MLRTPQGQGRAIFTGIHSIFGVAGGSKEHVSGFIFCEDIPFGNSTKLWKMAMFSGQIIYKWIRLIHFPSLNYQKVGVINPQHMFIFRTLAFFHHKLIGVLGWLIFGQSHAKSQFDGT
jgi:hypothetical protein